MDYRFTPEEEAFRQEVRTFLRAELPEGWDYDPFELHDENWEFALAFTKRLAGRGGGGRRFRRAGLREGWASDRLELQDENWEFALAFTKRLAGRGGWRRPGRRS